MAMVDVAAVAASEYEYEDLRACGDACSNGACAQMAMEGVAAGAVIAAMQLKA